MKSSGASRDAGRTRARSAVDLTRSPRMRGPAHRERVLRADELLTERESCAARRGDPPQFSWPRTGSRSRHRTMPSGAAKLVACMERCPRPAARSHLDRVSDRQPELCVSTYRWRRGMTRASSADLRSVLPTKSVRHGLGFGVRLIRGWRRGSPVSSLPERGPTIRLRLPVGSVAARVKPLRHIPRTRSLKGLTIPRPETSRAWCDESGLLEHAARRGARVTARSQSCSQGPYAPSWVLMMPKHRLQLLPDRGRAQPTGDHADVGFGYRARGWRERTRRVPEKRSGKRWIPP